MIKELNDTVRKFHLKWGIRPRFLTLNRTTFNAMFNELLDSEVRGGLSGTNYALFMKDHELINFRIYNLMVNIKNSCCDSSIYVSDGVHSMIGICEIPK